MSSRQVNFYIHPNDQEWFEGRLRNVGPMEIISGLGDRGEAMLSASTFVKSFGQDNLRVYLVLPGDLGRLRAIAAHNIKPYIDDLRSPVIEFTRCYFDGRILRRGRIYMVESYFGEDGQLEQKDPEFVKWGRRLIGEVRRALERRPDGDFCSPLALELERSGTIALEAS